MATILAIGALAATLIVSLLPARWRTAVPVLLIGTVATATVAFGTDIASKLPKRIVATHAAADVMTALHKQIPQLDTLTKADPLVEFELSSAFHTAYMAEGGSPEARASQAGTSFGLAVQQALLRNLSQLSDGSARRLIGLERQILEVLAEEGPQSCGPQQPTSPGLVDPANAQRLAALRRSVLRAKVEALVDLDENAQRFDLAEQARFEAMLLAEAARAADGQYGDSRCERLLAFYSALQRQPVDMQGKWVRSRQIFSMDE